jgi:hypothetical protein
MSTTICRGTATSAIWKVTYRPWLTTSKDNHAFLTGEFLQSLQAMPDRQRRRFYEGIYQAEIDGAGSPVTPENTRPTASKYRVLNFPIDARAHNAREGGEVDSKPWPTDQVERWPIDRLIPSTNITRTASASAIGVLTEFCSTALSSRSSSPREWWVFSVPIGTSIRSAGIS